MRSMGFVLLIGGFLVAAYSTALDTQATNWMLFLPAALVAAGGVIIVRRQASGEARSEDVLSANRAELRESLGNIVRELATLNERRSQIDTADLHTEIDERLREDLRRFADARESLVHLFSLQTYANIMSEFAAGERYVNRVWSASADGYGQEATDYLQAAAAQFGHALNQLEAADSS